jgi:hypothetical protein
VSKSRKLERRDDEGNRLFDSTLKARSEESTSQQSSDMCHWVLRVVSLPCRPYRASYVDLIQWECGDSFFTKYSSCSFDRAAHDPSSLLNPLHPSIAPYGWEKATSQPTADAIRSPRGPRLSTKTDSRSGGSKGKSSRNSRPSSSTPFGNGPKPSRPALPDTAHSDIDITSGSQNATANRGRDDQAGEVVPFPPLSEVGKASRFGDKMLGESAKCNVFEVVLQTKELTKCPACARSPKRARLPAHARGCFGLS